MTGSMIVPLVDDNLDSIERDMFLNRQEREEHLCHSDWQRYLHNHLSLSLLCSHRIGEEKESQLEIFWSEAVRTTDTLLSHFLLLLFVVCVERRK